MLFLSLVLFPTGHLSGVCILVVTVWFFFMSLPGSSSPSSPSSSSHYCSSSLQGLVTRHQSLHICDLWTVLVPVFQWMAGFSNIWPNNLANLAVTVNTQIQQFKKKKTQICTDMKSSACRHYRENLEKVITPLFLLRALSFLLSLSIPPSNLALTPGLPSALAHLLASSFPSTISPVTALISPSPSLLRHLSAPCASLRMRL